MYKSLIKFGSFLISIRNYFMSVFLFSRIDIANIPIVINNRNRLTFLSMLIEYLEKAGCKNIIILDNASTYPPLLEYYKTLPHNVIMLNQNLGYNALEKIDLYKQIRKNFYVYTDSDVVPNIECPFDFMSYFLNILRKYPLVQKVGFSLRIDNLPDCYEGKEKVIKWESQFYENEIEKGVYSAAIDTTFALHRPYALISKRGIFKMIRTGVPYSSNHMPWYNNSANLSDEELYYINSVEIGTHWSKGIPIENDKFIKRTISKLLNHRINN